MIARALDAEVDRTGERFSSWGVDRRHRDTRHRCVPDLGAAQRHHTCAGPRSVPLRTLVRVAGQRRTIKESLQTTKGLTDPDQHQVHTRTSWHPWTILVMLAYAFLAIITTRSA